MNEFQFAERHNRDCDWSWDCLNEVYVTDCGHKTFFENGRCIEEKMRCPNCGRIIKEVTE